MVQELFLKDFRNFLNRTYIATSDTDLLHAIMQKKVYVKMGLAAIEEPSTLV